MYALQFLAGGFSHYNGRSVFFDHQARRYVLIDSHCHLDRLNTDKATLAEQLDAARSRGVQAFLCVGIALESLQSMLDIVAPYDDVYASAGMHPLELDGEEAEVVDRDLLVRWASDDRIVAVGETGLDYHYQAETANQQRESFALHLQVACEVDKPVIVHSRAARDDTIELLACYTPARTGVMHCFTEDWAMASKALDLGFYISFSGIVTFKNAGDLRDVAKKVPADRLLVETDAPYLAPVPYRGKPNQPAYVREVAECIAALRDIPLPQLAEQTSANFQRLFGVG